MQGHGQQQGPRGHHGLAGPGRMPSDDAMTLWLMVGLGVGIVGVAAVTRAAASWLIAHQLLVPADRAVVPLFGGAGLDTARLIALLGLLVLLVAGAVWWSIRCRALALAKESARPVGVVID